jgi:hypothetical protein
MSHMIKDVQQNRSIRKQRSPQDDRYVVLTLTPNNRSRETHQGTSLEWRHGPSAQPCPVVEALFPRRH